ncbi:antichymotrypsin-2-like [Haematobia irritans]|uniref:antichymotrypsin-2-like n=1 Tax=Haematobia irritans TaxID=7368 RepID=UPI003F5078D2
MTFYLVSDNSPLHTRSIKSKMGLQNRTPIVLSILALLLALASSSPIASDPHFQNSLEVFNSNLFSEIYKEYGSNNLIFSPFSIQTCVTMASIGAAGKTATDMEQSLGFVGQSSESVAENFHSFLAKYVNSKILQMANKFYVMDGYKVKDHFNEVLTNKFFSSAENINFRDSDKATDIINNWVKSKTDNAIKDLIKPNVITGDTRMFLLSAIHFKGMWQKPFAPEYTEDKDFYTSETTTVKVPMMYRGGRAPYGWYQDLEASAVRLPYAGSDLSMLIVLPNSRTGLTAMMKKMKTMPLDSFTKNMITSARSVDIYLPKFKAELDIKLNKILEKMGMESMFHDADFSNMLDTPEHIGIGNVLHKAVIEVSEEGTKAAAATGMEPVALSGPLVFNANHPFYYVIINEDSVPLFEGTFVGV